MKLNDRNRHSRRTRHAGGKFWLMFLYDSMAIAVSAWFTFHTLHGMSYSTAKSILFNLLVFFVCISGARITGGIYRQIWRYGGIQAFMRLFVADVAGFCAYFLITRLSPIPNLPAVFMVCFTALDLLLALLMRMTYRFLFKCGTNKTAWGRFLLMVLRTFSGIKDTSKTDEVKKKTRVAILGAGNIGVGLARELSTNKDSIYEVRCFIDVSQEKVGREILGLRVIGESENVLEVLNEYSIQLVVFAVPRMSNDNQKKLYEFYRGAGYKVMTYDTPILENAGSGERHLREFSPEELLFRRQQVIIDDRTAAYYKGKTILITGGGGSIGSELCRQLAKMEPGKLIILDIYENGAYDVQQELRIRYGDRLDLCVEICSIANRKALNRVFSTYRPQIVVNAAAHKHVPLMENNVIEAIENNIFGCRNVMDCCEEYGAERFMMVSTDKAVNPTNVMGATKRMCEMMMQCASTFPNSKVIYSATRFGNVLGSAGSVIPLFKRQIAAGGPLTITDNRIIRYFMTIPEASQLVLASGAMASNGELFVLDMGKPVRIRELAENMIRLMGARDIEIRETGLRPGEKLYEELLTKTACLTKTDNKLIFIDREEPQPKEDIDRKLDDLLEACATDDDEIAMEALRKAVPTFRRPEEVNGCTKEAIDKEKGK